MWENLSFFLKKLVAQNKMNLMSSIISVSQHSGLAEQDFNLSNDIDSTKNVLNSSVDADRESDSEERIEFHCSVCERQCTDLEQ